MLHCYKPRVAPAENDGTGEHRDMDVQAHNNSSTSRQPDRTSDTREDGRAPCDMRQRSDTAISHGTWYLSRIYDVMLLLASRKYSASVLHIVEDRLEVYMDVGVVAHATGSAYVEFNHTKVICAVYGPHAQTGRDNAFSEEGQLQCEFSYAPFAIPGGRRESKVGTKDDERELSTLLRQTLQSSVQVHQLTKSVVGVHVMVLQADGGELAVAIACASMALADAGIELYDLVTSCSVGFRGSQVILDPTKAEEKAGAGVMTIAIMPGSQEVTQWWQEGRFDGRQVAEALELCTDGCGCVHKMMENKLKACTTKTLKNQST